MKPANTLTPREVSRAYRISENTLKTWRRRGKGPKFTIIGRSIFYSASSVRYHLGPARYFQCRICEQWKKRKKRRGVLPKYCSYRCRKIAIGMAVQKRREVIEKQKRDKEIKRYIKTGKAAKKPIVIRVSSGCLITKTDRGRCSEWICGACQNEECLDIAAKHNWYGWRKVEP